MTKPIAKTQSKQPDCTGKNSKYQKKDLDHENAETIQSKERAAPTTTTSQRPLIIIP